MVQYKAILELQKIGLGAFRQLEREDKAYNDVMMLITRGLLKPSPIETVIHPDTKHMSCFLKRGMRGLYLEVTKNCNFYCRYCKYASSNSITRGHENINMSWETAKASVDFLYEHSPDSSELIIAFCGGEPLLNFDLIVKVITYVNSIFQTKKIKYMLTINGSLLDDKIIEFFVQHEVGLTISLDGPEYIQNKHRKYYANGGDTYQDVMRKIQTIKRDYPEYFREEVKFNAVRLADESLAVIEQFFTDLGAKDAMIELADLGGIDYRNNVLDLDIINEKETVDPSSEMYKDHMEKFMSKTYLLKDWHHNGPCVPGLRRIYIATDGKLYPCEKVLHNDASLLGTLHDGIDLKKADEILNVGWLSSEDCKKCWGIRFCQSCVAHCVDGELEKMTSAQKKQICHINIRDMEIFLKSFVRANDSHDTSLYKECVVP